MTMAVAEAVRLGPVEFPSPGMTLAPDIFVWAAKYLRQPDGPDAGEPWAFTYEQRRFLAWWYAFDHDGRFVYRTGVYRRSKGAGKNPFAAALCAIELVGPCRFSGERYKDGTPIAEPQYASWVQTAAVSRDQTRNAMTLMPAILGEEAVAEYSMEVGKELIYAHKGRCRMEAVTSSPRALEGGRATFVVMDETHHWLKPNEGHAMADVIARNAAKSRGGGSRRLAITNAHAPGEDSVAEHDLESYRLGTPDMLYDSVEAPDDTSLKDDVSLRRGIDAAYSDAPWVNPERLMAEIHDPRTTPAMAYRFYLNKIHAEEDKPFDVAKWAALARPGYRVKDQTQITLGFDGSISRDHTALVGTEIATGHQWVAGYWEPEADHQGNPRIDLAAVVATVEDIFERYRVWRFNCDPFYWRDMTAGWAGTYGADVVVDWPTNQYRKMAVALLAYRNAMQMGELSHDADPRFTAAIANAHKHMQNFRDDLGEPMWVIQKERPDSPLKIDAAMAGCLSWEARMAGVAEGLLNQTEGGGFFV